MTSLRNVEVCRGEATDVTIAPIDNDDLDERQPHLDVLDPGRCVTGDGPLCGRGITREQQDRRERQGGGWAQKDALPWPGGDAMAGP